MKDLRDQLLEIALEEKVRAEQKVAALEWEARITQEAIHSLRKRLARITVIAMALLSSDEIEAARKDQKK